MAESIVFYNYLEKSELETNILRIKTDIIQLAQFNATPENGVTRFSFSTEDKKARDYLINAFNEFGLQVVVDPVGNIRARLPGIEPNAPAVMTGSHIDTVLHGGMFDGTVGVVGALEVVRVLVENRIRTKHPIEVVIFSEEEGSNFGSTLAGSKSMTGKYNIENLKKIKSDSGVSMYEMAKKIHADADRMSEFVIRPGDVKAMIELHVEQGAVLDTESMPIGIVEAIAGMKTFQIEVVGLSNHAGATPMHLRRDPLQAAAKMICAIDRIIKEKANATTVATVGKILCYPNVSNVIPERVVFTLDIRDVDFNGIMMSIEALKKRFASISATQKVKINIDLIAENDAIKLSHHVIDVIEKCALDMAIPYKRMNSGAVHDASLLADITNVGMIFIPSIDGRSHVPEEKTDFSDIKIGCDLLLRSILMLTN